MNASVTIQVSNNCDLGFQLDGLIASPLIGIVHLGRGWLCQSTSASDAPSQVARTWASKDGQMCSMWNLVQELAGVSASQTIGKLRTNSAVFINLKSQKCAARRGRST
jgi:hypothetical protein